MLNGPQKTDQISAEKQYRLLHRYCNTSDLRGDGNSRLIQQNSNNQKFFIKEKIGIGKKYKILKLDKNFLDME